MGVRYRLTERAFIGGEIRERGAIVTLLPHEKPGAHMVKVVEMAAQQKAPVISAMPGPTEIGEQERSHDEPPGQSQRLSLESRGTPHISSAEPIDQDRIFLDRITAPVELFPKLKELPPSPGYLVIDTETNGFKDPRLASIALLFVDERFCVEHEHYSLIRPDGWEMEARAEEVNGLSMARLLDEGESVVGSLYAYLFGLASGRTLVAHNLEFDQRVMAGELTRAGLPDALPSGLCTMLAARKADGDSGNLENAYRRFCGKDLVDAHDARADARACLALLQTFTQRGHLP